MPAMSQRWKRGTWRLIVLWPLSVCTASAQTVSQDAAQASLDCFAESLELGLSGSECADGIVPAEAMMNVPGLYDPSDVRAVAEGLESLALNSSHSAVRIGAVWWLGVLGIEDAEAGRPLPGSVARLIGLYERTTWPIIRSRIIKLMIRQDDRPAALEFLTDVARRDDQWENLLGSPAATAIWALKNMGSDGVSVLRQLHCEGSVANRQAKASLERLAEAEFEIERHNH